MHNSRFENKLTKINDAQTILSFHIAIITVEIMLLRRQQSRRQKQSPAVCLLKNYLHFILKN